MILAINLWTKIFYIKKNGGERGIRTLGSITTTHAFQAC